MKRRPRQTDQTTGEDNASMPKYTIGVVSKLMGLPPQALRRYEETGLLEPARQSGKNRLYSDQDLAILREIVQLSDEGINAVGIRYIIQMRVHVRILQREVEEAHQAQQIAEAARDRAKVALQEAREHSRSKERSSETNRLSEPPGDD
jgi:DNA-binding transcriptional MerR regulator